MLESVLVSVKCELAAVVCSPPNVIASVVRSDGIISSGNVVLVLVVAACDVTSVEGGGVVGSRQSENDLL